MVCLSGTVRLAVHIDAHISGLHRLLKLDRLSAGGLCVDSVFARSQAVEVVRV